VPGRGTTLAGEISRTRLRRREFAIAEQEDERHGLWQIVLEGRAKLCVRRFSIADCTVDAVLRQSTVKDLEVL
jgi:hypothetical protein